MDMLTRFLGDMTEAQAGLLEQAQPGMKLCATNPIKMATGLALGDLEPAVAYDESRKLDTYQADALFLRGVNWGTIDVIEDMESGLGDPVFTANQSAMCAT